jgi:catechol 2,3-dioxygenase-like lactoylglutathione lyase family enzyme
MIHHVTLEVSDLERSASFYDTVLAPLGWRRHGNATSRVGWGIAKPWIFIQQGDDASPGTERVCFTASGMAAVRAVWEAGLAAGGKDDGEPAQRAEYGPSYFCAYLRDPDGYRLEVAVGSD